MISAYENGLLNVYDYTMALCTVYCPMVTIITCIFRMNKRHRYETKLLHVELLTELNILISSAAWGLLMLMHGLTEGNK